MANTTRLLPRLLELVGDSDEYFVSGSLSFLPLLGNYRQPVHDVDAAISQELFQKRKHLFGPTEEIRFLSLAEVAVASESPLAKVFSPRTGFVHVDGPDGLLDLSCYCRNERGFVFSLGGGLSLEIPGFIADRFRVLSWEGISYQAGPPESAFIPKAVWYLQTQHASLKPDDPNVKHLEDLKRLVKIIDWDFVRQLLTQGGLRWFGCRLPKRLDPFKADEILALQHRASQL
jgi:hypothetical protein